MVAYSAGRNAVVYHGSGTTSPVTYTIIGGLRNVQVEFDTGAVDVSNKNSAGYQEWLAAAGIWKMTITANGVFDDSTALKAVLASGADNPTGAFFQAKVAFANGDQWTGKFVMSKCRRTGNYTDAETYDITLESDGVLVFTAGT